MQNFNHSNNGQSRNQNRNANQNNNYQQQRGNYQQQPNNQRRGQQNFNDQQPNNGGFFAGVINWGVNLAIKYGKTFEIITWVLMVVGILFFPLLSIAMTYLAYCYSRINPKRGYIMMAVALIGGIVSWAIGASAPDDTNDSVVWYFWSE